MAKFIAKDWSLVKLQALSVEEQDKMARAYVSIVGSVKERREEERETAIVAGKLLYVLEIRLNSGKSSAPGRPAVYASNKSLTELFKDVTGEKPTSHSLTLKNAFGLVAGGFIAESDYDANSSNCLQLAARILDVAKSFEHVGVTAACAELKERSKDEAKNLRAIFDSLKPSKPMSAEDAIEAIGRIHEAGHGLLMFGESIDIILAGTDENYAASYIAVSNLMRALDDKMPESVKSKVAMGTPVAVTLKPSATEPAAAATAPTAPTALPTKKPAGMSNKDWKAFKKAGQSALENLLATAPASSEQPEIPVLDQQSANLQPAEMAA